MKIFKIFMLFNIIFLSKIFVLTPKQLALNNYLLEIEKFSMNLRWRFDNAIQSGYLDLSVLNLDDIDINFLARAILYTDRACRWLRVLDLRGTFLKDVPWFLPYLKKLEKLYFSSRSKADAYDFYCLMKNKGLDNIYVVAGIV